ncbi:PGL/p-HBAD biosynthesis glycosyltransferase [Pontiella desulfatans]|uniref:PGL/p-HBAD biosynthesis glycosyltransferase n=1 Tax=Pontiella desulfatans TaxID=2750659 RepID=A0A6C2U733_PONDE|nr:glycosyltransferase family 2 protein [Pontiella desulfatans]VGO15607.1 PGL/p-HBAD biosynthesis glycosyltransferase [Pontiella desulfatans]
MKISLVTASFNSASTIEDTFKSVGLQAFSELEYILVDGASSDATLELAGKYENLISKQVSEPDGGIYDAMNKGIRMATGDVVGLINSDDMLAAPDVLLEVAAAFEDQEVEAVYGDLVYVDAGDVSKTKRVWRSGIYSKQKLARGWYPAHPTVYLRRSVYERFGLFDLDFPLAADGEFLFRIFSKGIRARYIPKIMVRMRTGGATGQRSNLWRQNREIMRGMRKNGIHVSPLFFPAKLLNRTWQRFQGWMAR